MPSAAYPLLRRKRRRAFRLPDLGARARPIAIGLIAFSGVMAGVYAATRPAPVDVAQALALSRAALAAGNNHAASHNAQAALRTDPGSADAQLLLGRAELELEDGAAAEAALARARELGAPAATLSHLLAHARLLQGDPTGALRLLERPADPAYAARVRARALAALGRRGEAMATLRARLAAAPDDARASYEFGRLLFFGGEVGLADAAVSRAAAVLPGDPAVLTLKGELVRSRFGLVASLPWFEAALARDAFHYPALVEQAATLGELGRHREMLAATRAALLARPGDARALYLQAAMAARAGDRELARAMLAHLGSAATTMPGAALLGGAIEQATGQPEKAIRGWRELVRTQPMNLSARRLVAGAMLRSGDWRGATDLLAPVVARPDADPYALSVAARAAEAGGDRRTAAARLDRAARAGAAAAPVFATVESPVALAAAAATETSDPTYAVGAIRGYADSGRGEAALAAAQGLVRASPGAPDAQTALGDAHAALGRWAQAVEVYRRAADLRFDEPAMLRLVDALGRAGRAQEAAGVLSLFVSQNPRNLPAQRLLGRWQTASGDWDAAIETLEGVRQRVGATDAGLLAELARAYAGDGDGVVARRYGAAAYRLSPMNAAAVAAYAAALEADGDLAGAKQLAAKLRRLP